jgi:hypothetical protein
MRNPRGRFAAFVRVSAIAAVALTITSPVSAQFGGIKKKLKSATGQATETAAAPQQTAAGAPADGAVVLTDDVVGQLIAGLEAAQAEREAAAKADTPYGRYQQALAAYDVAKPKCEAAQQTFPSRMAADQKLADKYGKLVDKMVEAQSKGDLKTGAAYGDSAMAMMDPSCTVKQPQQPDNYYEDKRKIDAGAEQSEPSTPRPWRKSRRSSGAARLRVISRNRRRTRFRSAAMSSSCSSASTRRPLGRRSPLQRRPRRLLRPRHRHRHRR